MFLCGSLVLHVVMSVCTVDTVSSGMVIYITAVHYASYLVLFCNLKQKIGKIDVTPIFNDRF